MAIELTENTFKVEKRGNTEFEATAGQAITIETSPNGEEILNKTVPSGKVWAVHVSVCIEESDA